MSIQNKKPRWAASLALLAVSCSLVAQTRPPIVGYWVDGSGQIVKNSWGECWRTGSWTPALALPECDPGLVPKPAPMAAPAPAAVPAPAPQPEAKPVVNWQTLITRKPIVLEGAHFAVDSRQLLPGAHAQLDQLVSESRDHPLINFEVTGYTDSTGSPAYNLKLSQDRADSVKAYLVERGVAASRIGTKGYGEEKPIADNNTAAGRAQNRRVEIRYTDEVQTTVPVAR